MKKRMFNYYIKVARSTGEWYYIAMFYSKTDALNYIQMLTVFMKIPAESIKLERVRVENK